MNDRLGEDRDLRRYLLGAVAEEERARIEADALRDDGRYEELLAVEDELFHEYAQGGLSDVERRQFEERFLATPEGRERLDRARALLQRLRPAGSAARPAPSPYVRWLAAAAALIIAAGTAWLGWRSSRTRVREAGVPSAAPSPIPVPTPPSAAPVRVALALSPGLVRGGGVVPRAALPAAGEATLRLTLKLPRGARGPFSVVVASADGIVLWAGPAGGAAPGSVTVEIPGRSLPEGDYELVLSGPDAREVASYAFRVLND